MAAKVCTQVQLHYDDYGNWENKRDWLNHMMNLSNRYPAEKSAIMELIEEKREEEKSQEKVNSILKRSGMQVKKRTRRGFGKRASGGSSSNGDCETGDCGDDTNPGKKRKGLHNRGFGNRNKLKQSSNARHEANKENPPSGSRPHDGKLLKDNRKLDQDVKDELGVDIIKDKKTLQKFFLKSELEAPLYRKRLMDIYQIAYPTLKGENLDGDAINEIQNKKANHLEKMYLDLLMAGVSEIGFTA